MSFPMLYGHKEEGGSGCLQNSRRKKQLLPRVTGWFCENWGSSSWGVLLARTHPMAFEVILVVEAAVDFVLSWTESDAVLQCAQMIWSKSRRNEESLALFPSSGGIWCSMWCLVVGTHMVLTKISSGLCLQESFRWGCMACLLFCSSIPSL